jgi:hypothetical protein
MLLANPIPYQLFLTGIEAGNSKMFNSEFSGVSLSNATAESKSTAVQHQERSGLVLI